MENDDICAKYRGGGSQINYTPIFSPDGQLLYIPWKNVLQCYNVQTGERVTYLEGCEDSIISASFNPNNPNLLVACSSSGEIAVWKWKTEVLVSVIKITYEKYEAIEVISCNLLESNKLMEPDNVDGDILVYFRYKMEKEETVDTLGLFSFSKLEFKKQFPLLLNKNRKDKPLAIEIGGLPGAQFVAILCKKLLYIIEFSNPDRVVKCKSITGTRFTCLACHPEEPSVATGNSAGRIQVWNKIFKGKPSVASFHWHSLPVNTITYSPSGTHLYSGGEECVLVKWQPNNLNNNFLPRLPAPIVRLAFSPNNTVMAISMRNNAIQITDAQFQAKCVIQQLTWSVNKSIGLKYDPRTKSIILNGSVGNLQFYQPRNMSLLYNVC